MGGQKVAIIGAGRLGSLVATRMPGSYRKVVISRRKDEATRVADECGAVASDQLSNVRGCQAVFLTVPGAAVSQVVGEMAPHLEPGALVVNMATDVDTEELAGAFPNLSVVAAKVIGHAREMTGGASSLVLLDRVGERDIEPLRAMLSGLGTVLVEDEQKVIETNTVIIEAMADAHSILTKRLKALDLSDEAVQTAIATVGPGTLRSLAQGDIGPFMQQVLESHRLKQRS